MSEQKYTKEQADQVIQYLKKAGSPRNVNLISLHMKMKYQDGKEMLIEMKDDNLIHPTRYGKLMYFVGGEDILSCRESKDVVLVEFKPLKVDRYRRALYEELDALRASIPSIG